MAISIISTPDNFEPIYSNSIPFEIVSTFQAEENFKYIYNVYVNGSFKSKISTYPRPSGYGIYSPHYILQANCNTISQPAITDIEINSTSRATYQFTLGEQYNPGLTYGDTYLITSYLGTYLGLEFESNITSDLFIDDIVTIQKDNIAVNPWENGTASIIGITPSTLYAGGYTVFVDRDLTGPFLSGDLQFVSESGNITNLSRLSATSSTYVGWNASRQYEEIAINFGNVYAINQSNVRNLLTSYDVAYSTNVIPLIEAKQVYNDSYQTLDVLLDIDAFSSSTNLEALLEYFDASGATLGSDTLSIVGDSDVIRYTVPSGPQNIIDAGLSGASYFSSGLVDTYNIQMSIDSTRVSPKFNYRVIPQCRPYEIIRLTFLNKLGGYDYWDFNLVSRYTSNIERTQINRALRPNYNIGDRGRDVIYSKAVENWTINSDFLTDDDALFVRELVESPSVYMIDSKGKTLPIVITDNSWQFKSGLLDGYVQYTVNFIKAYDVYINR